MVKNSLWRNEFISASSIRPVIEGSQGRHLKAGTKTETMVDAAYRLVQPAFLNQGPLAQRQRCPQ